MNEKREQRVQLEMPKEVLSRLLRERSLVVSEIKCLNHASRSRLRQALLHSLKTGSNL